jgi:lipopolysaccharide/colanic/teichoic acid biosynthesis glycosyltransferase
MATKPSHARAGAGNSGSPNTAHVLVQRSDAHGGGRVVVSRRGQTDEMTLRTETSERPSSAQPAALANAEMLRFAQQVAAHGARNRTIYERFVKPVMDRLLAALLLVLLSPVLLCTALAVLVSLGSPIVIQQVRVGRNGKHFGMFKFRTMRPDRRRGPSPDYNGPERRISHKSQYDPRHTPVGRKLRKTSLDELPQLLNVIRGDMSLVGPRPELVAIVEQYHSWQHVRHSVKPGITGFWQITERSTGGLMHECTQLDLDYIERLSFRTDMKVLLSTPVALLRSDEVI